MPPKRTASPSEPSGGPRTYISNAIHDRNSTFIAYFLPECASPKTLQSRDDTKSASHRILAWRQPSSQRTIFPSSKPVYKIGHDDDGEQWAGKRIEKVLEDLDVQGAVMVARWYGGELLGPVRFKHMEDVAKEAIGAWHAEQGGGPAKKQRVEDSSLQQSQPTSGATMRPEELNRARKELVQTLQRRDESITTLRTLLEEKKKAAAPRSSQIAVASPSRAINYDTMPFNRLQALENARDASIGFLLKQIDKAEEDNLAQARKNAEAEAELKAVQEADDLDDAWEEMEAAMHQAADAKTASKKDLKLC